jgi:hypothetical protein
MSSSALYFFLPLAGLAALIALLGTSSSVIQQWVSNKRGSTADTQNTSQEKKERGNQLQRQRIIADLGTHIDAVAHAIHAYNQRRDAHERRRSKNEIITIIALSLAAAFAFLTFIAAGISDWIFRGQLVAMQQANDDNRIALHSVQRAFITVSNMREEAIQDSSGRRIWRYVPAIENSGTTPTTRMEVVSITPSNDWMVRLTLKHRAVDKYRNNNVKMSELINSIDMTYDMMGAIDPADIFSWTKTEIPELAIIPSVVLGPKGIIYPFNASSEISIEDARAMQGINTPPSNRLGKFFYGAIKYTDIFNEDHLTKYCFRIDNYAIRESGETPFPSLCAHWNCTDAACDDDKKEYDADVAAFYRKEEDEGKRHKEQREPFLKQMRPSQPPSQ